MHRPGCRVARPAPPCALVLLFAASPLVAQAITPAAGADWMADGSQAGSAFGRHVATAGDVNGDGYADIAIGAPLFDGAFTDQGRILVYLGSPSGPSATPAWTLDGDHAGAALSRAIPAGDVNGDGFDDLLVCDPYYSDQLAGRGRALLFAGSTAGLSIAPTWIVLGDAPNQGFGSRASAGDVNGDGFSDVTLISSRDIEVFMGSASSLETAPAWTLVEEPTLDFASGPAVQDVNGDGFADLAFTTFELLKSGAFGGRVVLYRGSPAGLGTRAARTIDVDLQGGAFLAVVTPAGDLNGDALYDLAVSTLSLVEPGLGPPEDLFVHEGTRTSIRPHGDLLLEVPNGTLNAYQIGPAGDVNRDGFADLLVPERITDPVTWIAQNRVLLFEGSRGGAGATPSRIFEPEQTGDGFGDATAAAGDVNGDGFDDIVVGAQYFSGAEPLAGRVYVFLGGPSF